MAICLDTGSTPVISIIGVSGAFISAQSVDIKAFFSENTEKRINFENCNKIATNFKNFSPARGRLFRWLFLFLLLSSP